MATENKQLNVNPLDWDTSDQTFVPDSGVIWYYYYADTIVSIVGDGVSTVSELRDSDGAEFSLVGATFGTSNPSFLGYKGSSDDIIYCAVTWPEIPKQGTGLSLTLPASALRFKDLDNNASSDVASFTISSLSITGKQLAFQLNQTGIATGMTNYTPSMSVVVGTGFTLTITD